MTGFKVIATDLDRTLLGAGGSITPRALAALAAARAHGMATVAVTARPHRAFEVWTWATDVFDAVICAGGTTVWDPATGAVAVQHTVDRAAAATAAARLRTAVPRFRFAVETGHDIVAEPGYTKQDSVLDRRRTCSSLEDVLAADGPFLKLLAHVPGGRVDELVEAAVALELEGVRLWEAGSRDQIELGPLGVDKGTSLAAWARRRGFAAEHVVAFGDAPTCRCWCGRAARTRLRMRIRPQPPQRPTSAQPTLKTALPGSSKRSSKQSPCDSEWCALEGARFGGSSAPIA